MKALAWWLCLVLATLWLAPPAWATAPAPDLHADARSDGSDAVEQLQLYLHGRATLLVLDNFEQLVAPGGAVVRGNHESEALRWLTLTELEQLADEPGLLRLAGRGLSAYRDARIS